MYNKDPALKFNFADHYSPHFIVPRLVGRNKVILDVGCNQGYLGAYLIKNKNCICDGIDIDKKLLVQAKKKGYRNTFKIDLYKTDFKIKEKYDILMFIDILEHLPNPYLILKKMVRENLKTKGKAIICLPNIARLEHRINHLLGKFNYQTSGIMHQDHLRFFTRESALQMIKKTNLRIEKILPTGLGAKTEMLPNLLSFQFIFICKKEN